MRCQNCSKDVSEAFFIPKESSLEFKGGRFSCPHCQAEHIRRDIGKLPSGAPLQTFRLWGHPLAPVGKPATPQPAGAERRQTPRVRPRR